MTTLDALLAGIVAEPREEARWLVLADWLDEYDDPRRAEVLRLHRKLIATCCAPDAHPERAAWQARMVELLVAGVVPCVPRHTLTLPGGVPLVGAFIPPGTFLMGGTVEENEKPIHEVAVAGGLFMGIYPVTQAQWAAVTSHGSGGWLKRLIEQPKRAATRANQCRFKGPLRPMEGVSWDGAQEFCAKLSAMRLGAAVSLPTEEEWEFACRAGTTTHYHFGDALNTNLANYNGNYSWNGSPSGAFPQATTDVGSFVPNAWGLHDLHGNVREWCANPDNNSGKNAGVERGWTGDHWVRGGSWYNNPINCRAACRGWSHHASHFDDTTGFRVCFRLN